MSIYYRGGPSVKPRSLDVAYDPDTGLLLATRGVSLQDNTVGLDRFGGAYEVVSIPPSLQIIRRGTRGNHFELAPAVPMTFDDYDDALELVILRKVTP